MSKKQILLTGASGFIGKNLQEWLKHNYTLYAPTHDELNLLDKHSIEEFFQKNKIDVVIHTANCNNTKRTVSEYDVIRSNLCMFYNLVSQQANYEKMLYFGSGAEYGKNRDLKDVCEEDFGSVIPEDAYGLSKYVMAQEALKSEKIYDVCIFGVYGPYEEYNRRFISNAICRAIVGMPITLSQNAMFSYLYMDDLSKIVPWFIENKPREHRYNVTPDASISLLDLAKMVRQEFDDIPAILVQQEGWKHAYTGNSQKLLLEMGNFPFTSPNIGIRMLRKYYEKIQINDSCL